MDKAVRDYKKRRKARLDAKNGVAEKADSVEEYKKRRKERLLSRMDAGVGWVFGVLQENGVETKGMSVKEAFEALEKINGGKGGDSEKEASGSAKKSKAPEIKKSSAKNHEHDGSNYKGDPGEVKSGKNGNLKPKNEASKRINCADAADETNKWKTSGGKEGRETNSLTGYIDENGNLTPERQKVHDEIVQNFFKDKIPQEGKATMTMSGGGPASGKSFIKKAVESRFGKDTTITVDPDEIKEMLPGYTDMAIKTDDAAGHYHEESSALAKRIYQYAVDNNLNVVYDGTGDGSVNSVKKKIKTARDAGYEVNGEYVTVDVDGPGGALARNLARYESGKEKFAKGESDVPPRLPKETHVRKIHAEVSDIVPEVFGLFDNFKLFDNNGERGSEPTLVATSKMGENLGVEDGQIDKLTKFLGKGKKGWKFSDGKFHN